MLADLKPYPEMRDSGVEWLGEIPAHWETRRVRSVARVLNGATPSTNTPAYWEGDIPWITPEDLGRLKIRYINDSARRITRTGYVSCGTSLAPANSLAISTRAPIGHIGILRRAACVNQGCRLLIPDDEVHAEYLYHELLALRPELEALGQGTTFSELSAGKLSGFALALPPLKEQAAIARFLDYADRRIQRYIGAKQKLIALLEEQKKALIHEAVTGRIDVRTGRPYPAYKESGVEWLGTVPAHWDVWRSKRAFKPRTELARPGDIQLSATQAYGVIEQADYEEKIGRKITRILRHLDQRRHVEIDDFVISMRSFQGGLERAWTSGCIRSSYIVLHAAAELIVGYFGYLFKSAGYIAALQSTANFIRDGQDLNFENFCRVDVPFPPVEEQQLIAQAVDRGTDHIDASIECSRRQIGSLREYRARLIGDVVTGKLNVREAVVRLTETDSLGAEDDPADGVIAMRTVR